MAALAAVATDEARDAVFPLLFLVNDYLTHDQLMPPVGCAGAGVWGAP